MEPKFQSSFIPRGPASSVVADKMANRHEKRSLISFLTLVVFIISIVLAFGMFGYKYYLKYSINKMSSDLETVKETLQEETIRELTRLNNRVISTRELLDSHQLITPLFEFIEASTPVAVRFNDFQFYKTERGL